MAISAPAGSQANPASPAAMRASSVRHRHAAPAAVWRNRAAPQARYRQVATELRSAIKRGEYPPGSALPSQPELARLYGLNQTSINRAITLLRSEGLVRVEHGRGAFVQEIPTVKRVRRIPRGNAAGSSFAEPKRSMCSK
jgi:GntR family transcriptional regulator